MTFVQALLKGSTALAVSAVRVAAGSQGRLESCSNDCHGEIAFSWQE